MTRKYALAIIALALLAGLSLAAPSNMPASAVEPLPHKQPMPQVASQPSAVIAPQPSPARVTGPKVWVLQEGFEGTWLPTGWSLAGGASLWSQYACSGYGVGSYSARANFYSVSSGSQDLITLTFTATAADDSLKFDHAYATYVTENDQLQISTSTNGGSTWSVLVTLDGGVSGPLNTAGAMTSVFVPTAGQWATKSYLLPAGTNAVKFTAITAYGNQLYLDNVAVGRAYTPVDHDVTVESIDVPNTTVVSPGVPFNLVTTIRNLGFSPETGFNSVMVVTDSTGTEIYNASIPIISPDTLYPDSSRQFVWGQITPAPFMKYHLLTYTALAGDQHPENDSLGFDFRTWDLDVGCTAIAAPVGNVYPEASVAPTATYHNFASQAASFVAHLQIDYGANTVYHSQAGIVDLTPGTDTTIAFPDWASPHLVGAHQVYAYTVMDHDLNQANDTATAAVNSSYSIWSTWTPMGTGMYGIAECGWGGRLYCFGGNDAVVGYNTIQWYDTLDASWHTSARTLPTLNFFGCAVAARGNIYVLGGMSAWGAAGGLTTVLKYLPDYDSLETMAPLPTVAADFAVGVWRDSLIYRLAGGNWSGGAPLVTTVEVYDVVSNTWTTATPLPAVIGCNTASIIGDTIVVSTGRIGSGTYVATTYVGVIDPANPTTITWSTGANYPGGIRYRAQGTKAVGQHFVFGGQNSGGVYATCYSYSPGSNVWTQWPDKTTPTANNSGAAVIGDWLALAGGMTTGSIVINNTEALFLGAPAAADPVLTATSPADEAAGVHRHAPVVFTFSKPMDVGSIIWNCNPDPGGWSAGWNLDQTQITWTHAPFDYSTNYSVTVTAGQSLDGYSLATSGAPNPFEFDSWDAPAVIADQTIYGVSNSIAAQIFEPAFSDYTCWCADDINVSGLDSVKVTAVEITGVGFGAHSFHLIDSLNIMFTQDNGTWPDFGLALWNGNLAQADLDDTQDGNLIAYLASPVTLPAGKSWLVGAPYMNYNAKAKDGQWMWSATSTINGTEGSWINPGNGFGNGTGWVRLTVLGTSGDLVFRALGYSFTGVTGKPTELATPAVFALLPNYPNPAKGRTTFSFTLPRASEYSLKVYNITGQLVRDLKGAGKAGLNNVEWSPGRNGNGVYFYTLSAGGQNATRKLVVVK